MNVDIFLAQQCAANERQSSIKKEELVWVKLYILYVGVISAAFVSFTKWVLARCHETHDFSGYFLIYDIVVFICTIVMVLVLSYLRLLYHEKKIEKELWDIKLKLRDKYKKNDKQINWYKYTSPNKGNTVYIISVLIFSFLFLTAIQYGFLEFTSNTDKPFDPKFSPIHIFLAHLILGVMTYFVDNYLFRKHLKPKIEEKLIEDYKLPLEPHDESKSSN